MVQIPITADTPYFQEVVLLDGVAYTLVFRWNVRANSWYLDILDETGETTYHAGVRMVVNFPLLLRVTGRKPPGWLVLNDSSGAGLDPGLSDLGTRCLLNYYSTSDLAAMATGAF